ncbi:CD151 antigen-like [Bacillus rossius redtenbacheri]|uniref:CD151 antigen-like n=1 Tax=Bacillus rossius redtenbacheri TaxID=93214 RepID=UPI002FDE5140
MCCETFVAKYCLCIFNFLFFLAGAAALGVGIWIAQDKHSFIAVTQIIENKELQIEFGKFTQPTVIEQASYILIAAGAFVFIVSFIGYCGAVRESRCLLATYGVLLLLILLLEVTAGGLAAAYRKETETETRNFLKNSIKKFYSTENPDAVSLMWTYFMAQMKCCGVDSGEDFNESPWGTSKERNSKKVPEACCILVGDMSKFTPKDPLCPVSPSESNSYYSKGCYKRMHEWLMDHINVMIGIGIGLGLLQLLGIFFAFCLCRSIDSYIK